MSAAVINLDIEQGATFRQQFQWFNPDGTTPIDLTGCSAKSQWRASIDSTEVLIELSTANGKIVIDAVQGMVTLHLSAVETAALQFTAAVYDLEISFPLIAGEVPTYRLAKGKIKVSKEITRG